MTYSQYCRFLIEVDRVHNNEHLLVLVGQARVGLLESSLAVILDPAVLPQEGGGEAQGEPELERETVNAGRQEDRNSAWRWTGCKIVISLFSQSCQQTPILTQQSERNI